MTMQPHLICWHYPLQIRREFPEFRIYRLWDTPIGKLVILSRAFAIGQLHLVTPPYRLRAFLLSPPAPSALMMSGVDMPFFYLQVPTSWPCLKVRSTFSLSTSEAVGGISLSFLPCLYQLAMSDALLSQRLHASSARHSDGFPGSQPRPLIVRVEQTLCMESFTE